jgi:long-subunit acyl-CoA synthetase (AMP-forming)
VTTDRNLALAKASAPDGGQLRNIDVIDASAPTENFIQSVSPDRRSWVLSTSGSAGLPKGVVQNYRTVLCNAMKHTQALHICMDDSEKSTLTEFARVVAQRQAEQAQGKSLAHMLTELET